MKHKLKAFTLALLSIFFVFGGKVSAETVNIVSDTAYAPFNLKILIKLIKESMLTSLTKSLSVLAGMLT